MSHRPAKLAGIFKLRAEVKVISSPFLRLLQIISASAWHNSLAKYIKKAGKHYSVSNSDFWVRKNGYNYAISLSSNTNDIWCQTYELYNSGANPAYSFNGDLKQSCRVVAFSLDFSRLHSRTKSLMFCSTSTQKCQGLNDESLITTLFKCGRQPGNSLVFLADVSRRSSLEQLS